MSTRQRGVALILALLVVALAAILAIAITVRAQTEFRRSQMLLHGDQALHYVLGAEQWVSQILRRDRTDGEVDHRGEPWATELPPLAVEGGTITGRVEDLNGRFNLANLLDADGAPSGPDLAQFRRLLQVLGLADQLAPAAVLDFIDPDSETTPPDGAEDAYYLGTDPPHRAPNRPPAVLSELALLRDFDQALLPVMAPHVVALPARTRLNVNTLTLPVMMSLGDDVTEAHASGLSEAYADGGFDSVEQFRESLGGAVDPGIELGLQSRWFQLTVRVDIGTTTLTMYSLLERAPQGPTRVVARSQTPW